MNQAVTLQADETGFVPYIHLERYGTDPVDGIEIGTVHVFPKIDGTNASFWWEDGRLQCGSRNRVLSFEKDNAGFCKWMHEHERHQYRDLAMAHPHLRFYGEWLVPHSLKTYRDDAWRNLYIFDVYDLREGRFLHYDEYTILLRQYDVTFIPCIAKAHNPSYEQLADLRDRNKYLIKDDAGAGEGIVIKQYGWRNRFGHQTWAKLITTHFKDKHIEVMGGSVIVNKMVEEAIAEEAVTKHLVDKVVAKIRNDQGAFTARDIPRLLGTVWHDVVTEELWNALKTHKNPRVDFKALNHMVVERVKVLLPEVFGRKA